MADREAANAALLVVDASAMVSALTFAGVARERLSTASIFAPALLDLEVAQALRRASHGGRLDPSVAALLLGALRQLGLTRYPVHGLTERIWELRDNVTAYDASYVAVAESLDCPLVTADARLAAAPGLRCSVEVVPN